MRRYISDMWAWCRSEPAAWLERQRERERFVPFVVALVVIASAGGVLGSRAESTDGPAAPDRGAVVADAADADAAAEHSAEGAGDEASAEAAEDARTVSTAWRERALEREREAVADRFAERFGISAGLAEEIHTAAVEESIEPEVAFGLVRTESSFRRTAVSWAGAVGYTQLLPSTARWIAPGTSRSDLFDTRTNLRVGFKYLRYLIDKYDGNTRLALLAYNRGPGTVDGLLRRGIDPANGYARKVLSG